MDSSKLDVSDHRRQGNDLVGLCHLLNLERPGLRLRFPDKDSDPPVSKLGVDHLHQVSAGGTIPEGDNDDHLTLKINGWGQADLGDIGCMLGP